MGDRLHFAVDLYQGTSEYYDRYRLPYPEAMIEDLIARTGVSGQGRLLDLARKPTDGRGLPLRLGGEPHVGDGRAADLSHVQSPAELPVGDPSQPGAG